MFCCACKLIRRLRTGFVILLNSVPIYWFSKKQGSCEVSAFGSEFVAMRQRCEYIRGLLRKLQIIGISVNNPTIIYSNKQSVLWNISVPDSALKKRKQLPWLIIIAERGFLGTNG